MVFSSPLLDDGGKTLLASKLPVAKDEVIKWASSGVVNIFCRGELIGGQKDKPLILEVFRKQLMSQKTQEVPSEEPVTKKESLQEEPKGQEEKDISQQSYERKLASLEIIEQITDSLSFGLTQFLQNPTQSIILREKLVIASEALIKGMKQNPSHFIDIITFMDPGNPLVSHLIRVAIIATLLAIQMNVSAKRLLTITAASFLHDIGKIGYTIVNDAEGLNISKEKMNLNLSHPVYGYKITKNYLNFQDEVCQAILNHHEQPDGTGFPRRVDDTRLFITDKIIYLANVFSHLIEKGQLNGYHTPLNNLDYLFRQFPEKFDGELVNGLQVLKQMFSYELLHVPPSTEETVIQA
ncbi:MAG: hypothetical protein IEMM0008_0285 [bacterium]|nr:MAG: hypothetical protein IEMM0008_0285 [bacterium]